MGPEVREPFDPRVGVRPGHHPRPDFRPHARSLHLEHAMGKRFEVSERLVKCRIVARLDARCKVRDCVERDLTGFFPQTTPEPLAQSVALLPGRSIQKRLGAWREGGEAC